MTLTDVKYNVQRKKDLIVDLKLRPKEQMMISSLAKKISGKRKLVMMVNGKIIQVPKDNPRLSISDKSQSQVHNLMDSLTTA